MTKQEQIRKILKDHWGYDSFRPLQEDIILSVMDGRDTLALLPTGGGKSICFQVPGLALDGLCIVISPLIALMKDQVANLKKRHIKAAALYSGMSKHEIELVLNNCAFDPEFKFLYVSPERLKTDNFRATLSHLRVGLFDAQSLQGGNQRKRPIGKQRHIFYAQIIRQSSLQLLMELTIIGNPFALPYLLQIAHKLVQRREQGRGHRYHFLVFH